MAYVLPKFTEPTSKAKQGGNTCNPNSQGSGVWEAVEVRLADLWGSLASQPSLLGKFYTETISKSIDNTEE